MHRLMSIAGVILAGLGVLTFSLGATYLLYGLMFTSPSCSGPPSLATYRCPPGAVFVIGGAGITFGIAQVIAGLGTVRHSRRAAQFGALLSALALAVAAWVGQTAFHSIATAFDVSHGGHPQYDQAAVGIAVTAIPYAFVLIALVIGLRAPR